MKALIVRPGAAVGDAIWVSALPRLIKESGYDQVHVAVSKHNFDVFQNNPYIDELHELPMNGHSEDYAARMTEISRGVDKLFGVSGHVEVKMLFRTDAYWGDIPSGQERREMAAGVSYQDRIFKELGFDTPGILPEFYLNPEEEEMVARIKDLKQKRRERLVLWQWTGSSKSKELVMAPHYLTEVMKKVPNAIHYIWSQDRNMQMRIPDDRRCINMWGKTGIRQSILLTKAADMVIGPESLLVNAAGAFDTPKMVFFSHSSPENLVKYYKHCFAVTPDPNVGCSPCYLIHVDFRGIWHPQRRAIARTYEINCQTANPAYTHQMQGYKCCVHLPHGLIVDTIVNTLKHGAQAAARKSGGGKKR